MVSLKPDNLYVKGYKNLKIDKQLDHIGYNDEYHVYFDVRNGLKYTSVTTLIHMYQPEYDTDFWS